MLCPFALVTQKSAWALAGRVAFKEGAGAACVHCHEKKSAGDAQKILSS